MNLQDKIDKISRLEFDEAEKLIYTWVKQGVITLGEFRKLNKANRDSL